MLIHRFTVYVVALGIFEIFMKVSRKLPSQTTGLKHQLNATWRHIFCSRNYKRKRKIYATPVYLSFLHSNRSRRRFLTLSPRLRRAIGASSSLLFIDWTFGKVGKTYPTPQIMALASRWTYHGSHYLTTSIRLYYLA